MADITLKLVWYRLGETYTNMADRYEKFLEWYEDFSWRRVDILDMLFLGWLLAAFLVVGAINIYLKFFGKAKGRGDTWARAGGGGAGTTPPGEGETCQWVNSVLSWLYLHYDHTPEFVDGWLKSLNEHARKHSGDIQVKFDRLQAGSLPPKFTRIHTESTDKDTMTLQAFVESAEISFLVSTLQQSGANIKVSNCDVCVTKLSGQLKVLSHYHSDTIDISASFVSPPDIKLQVKPKADANIDPKTVENVVRQAITSATSAFALSPKGGLASYSAIVKTDASQTGTVSGKSFSLRDRRLLVKIIKANSLGDKDFGCSDPYCLVSMDTPQQKHTTSVVRNTINPFWDEHFLFDLDDSTKHVKFEVFDREKPPGEDFLGRAMIAMTDLRRMPSSRQIIPLTGKVGANGTITVEFLFMEPAEAQQMSLSARTSEIGDGISPRRRIETSRQVLPSGTVVTQTRTTTEKPRDIRLDASYSDSPNRIQKSDSLRPQTDYSPYSSLSSQTGGQDGTSQGSQGRPFESPTVTVTQPGKMDGHYHGAHRPMSESTTPEDGRDGRSMSTISQASDAKEMKKSRSFASAIKKRFQRPKKPRSHSADRAGSLRNEHLLKPPETGTKTTDDLDQSEIPEGGLRKSRSHSFSSSLKKLFRKKKKDYPSSRESSVSRVSGRGYDDSSYGQPSTPRPVTYRDARHAQPSPDMPDSRLLSTSVPVTAPIYDH